MAMPSAWIDRLFDELQMAYGHRFLSQWPGTEVEAIKADWAKKLDGFEQHRESLKFALAHLPSDNPVNALQFRDLCRRAPEPKRKAIEAPEVPPEVAQAAASKAAQAFRPDSDPLSAIRPLMRRELAGDKSLTQAQREFWRQAMRHEILHRYNIDTSRRFDLADLKAAIEARSERVSA